MADITKCTGAKCPTREQCKRYTPDNGLLQSYFATPPLQDGGTCEYYWGINQVSIMDEIEENKEGYGKKTTCEN